MDKSQNIYEAYLQVYSEGIASEHPDISGQKEFAKKADEELARRRKERAKKSGPQLPKFLKTKKGIQIEEKDHEYSMARTELHKIDGAVKKLRKKLKGEGNIEAWVQSKITRAADYLDSASTYIESGEHDHIEEDIMLEREMTPSEVRKEKRLKGKYDDSGMKKSMIDQYGEEKGKQVYFATIRKQAMANSFEPEGEQLDENPLVGLGLRAGAAALGGYLASKGMEAAKKKVDSTIDKARKTSPIGGERYSSQLNQLKQSIDYDGETLEEKKLSRTERREQNQGKKKKGGAVHAYDMDETLFGHDHSKVKVHVKDDKGKRVQSLTNQEFNTHKLPKGHSYDFGEFRSSKVFTKSAKPNKGIIKKLKKQVKQGKNVHIITARGDMDDQKTFSKHLKKHGINIEKGGKNYVHVHRAGNVEGGDIGEKKKTILHGLMKKAGTKKGHMYDDAAKVHKAMEKANKETVSGPKVKTHMVKPNKEGKVVSRSYQATKEEFEVILDFILEQLVDQGYVENLDSALDLVDTFEEDYVDDLISQSIGLLSESVEDESALKFGYVSRFTNRTENTIEEDDEQLTPYEYWKTFIGEDDIQEEVEEEVISEEVIVENKKETTYEQWKKFIEQREVQK